MATQNNPRGGQSPADKKPSTPWPRQPVSGTWFQKEHPQILIQWTLSPPSPSHPEYTAEVGIYQLIFDTKFPVQHLTGSTVPFSLMDPANETTPYLQGSLVLLQPSSEGHHSHKPDHCTPPGAKDLQPSSKRDHGPILKVVNLQFPGFKALNLPLFPDLPIQPGSWGSRPPAWPAAGGGPYDKYPQSATETAEEDTGD